MVATVTRLESALIICGKTKLQNHLLKSGHMVLGGDPAYDSVLLQTVMEASPILNQFIFML
jgi:hypothetical protein